MVSGRLQAGARSDVRRVRAAALPYVRDRIDVRAADLPMAAVRRRFLSKSMPGGGANQEKGKASLLFAYALGKAQRILAGVDASIGPIYTHGAVERLNRRLSASGRGAARDHPCRHAPASGTGAAR